MQIDRQTADAHCAIESVSDLDPEHDGITTTLISLQLNRNVLTRISKKAKIL